MTNNGPTRGSTRVAKKVTFTNGESFLLSLFFIGLLASPIIIATIIGASKKKNKE